MRLVAIFRFAAPSENKYLPCMKKNISGSNSTGKPEVTITADRRRVGVGGPPATLTCVVTRGSPRNFSYSWRHEGVLLPDMATDTLVLSISKLSVLGVYICEVMNVFGVGRGNITIEEGGEACSL